MATLISLLFIGHLFPLSFLAGTGGFFEQIDASQHVSGWLFYVRDAWHFPLLDTGRINHPDGVSIAFTDSIPVAALLFKLFSAWLPARFHYFGLWHALAFTTQAVAATFLMRALGVRHVVGVLAAMIFALTWPALLWRLGHTSLMTHSIILFALASYFLACRGQWSANRAATMLVVSSVIGLMIHPYFLAFSYPLFLALLAEQALAGAGWRKQVPRLLASLAAIGMAGMLFGYFGRGGTTTFGFGYYSMNLSAPFCGGRFIVCAAEATNHQFGAYRFADVTGGQYEGYNYFGAGLLLLLPIALASMRSDIKRLVKRFPALTVLMVLFTLYALSTTIYFNSTKLVSYSLPAFVEPLTGTFRASGRFFWMVGYLALFAVLAALLKQGTNRNLTLLVVALSLQWFDTQPLQERIQAKAALPASGDLAAWTGVLAGVEKIHVFPAFGCDENDVNAYWFFQRLAAYHGKLIDTGYIARPSVDCRANRQVFDGNFLPRRLYVMSADYLKNPFAVPAGFREAGHNDACVRWRHAVVCRTDVEADFWKKSGLPTEPLTIPSYAEWKANELPTNVGRIQDGRLVPANPSQAGFLSFGPYITLPPGRYHYAIDYLSDTNTTLQVGRWDISLNGKPSATEIDAGPIAGTAGRPQRITGDFVAGNSRDPLEIRTFFAGQGDLQLIGITLSKDDTVK